MSLYRRLLTVTLDLRGVCPQDVSILTRIERIGRMGLVWRKEIKKFVAFPGLTPLQSGSDVHPYKQACLLEPPYLSGLPIGRQETIKTK